MTTPNPPRQRSGIDMSKVQTAGLHGLKIGNEISQMIFSGPADAISFAQRLKPVRGADKIAVIPIVITEKEFRR
jgi:hypothetical protein